MTLTERPLGTIGTRRTGLGRQPATRGPLGSLRSSRAAPWRHVDLVLVLCVGLVQFVGLVMVFSTTRGANAPYRYGYVTKQAVYALIGVVVMVAIMAIDYRRFRDIALLLYGGMVVLLLAVLTPLGTVSKGHQGWFSIGSFQLQPSEFAKVVVVITLAAVASQFNGQIDLRRLGTLLLLAVIPMGLVLLQGDLGTTLVFAVVVPAMLLVAGARSQHLAALVVLGVIGAGLIVGGGMLKTYQQDRLTSFLKQDTKSADIQGASYNLNQSKTAIGSGGAWGKGLFKGTQTRLGIVPEQQTDFIFSAVGEQLGFVGAGTLIGLFGIIVWRIWRAAQLARDEFGTLLCIGLLAMLLFHVFENVGMTMGIMPITGIPLPFLSYGGSSTVVNFAAVGLVLSVRMRRFA